MKHITITLTAMIALSVTAKAGILLRKKNMTYDVFNRQTSWTQSGVRRIGIWGQVNYRLWGIWGQVNYGKNSKWSLAL